MRHSSQNDGNKDPISPTQSKVAQHCTSQPSPGISLCKSPLIKVFPGEGNTPNPWGRMIIHGRGWGWDWDDLRVWETLMTGLVREGEREGSSGGR